MHYENTHINRNHIFTPYMYINIDLINPILECETSNASWLAVVLIFTINRFGYMATKNVKK